jgi:hypothetical protein
MAGILKLGGSKQGGCKPAGKCIGLGSDSSGFTRSRFAGIHAKTFT